jgi:hypothetical protein
VSVLEAARVDLGLTVPGLWLDYFALGGRMDVTGLAEYLTDLGPGTSSSDHDALVHALNEAYVDAGSATRLPYRAA